MNAPVVPRTLKGRKRTYARVMVLTERRRYSGTDLNKRLGRVGVREPTLEDAYIRLVGGEV